jgi:hypothetical protein
MARIVPNQSAFWKRNEIAGDSLTFKKRRQFFVSAHKEPLSVVLSVVPSTEPQLHSELLFSTDRRYDGNIWSGKWYE